MIELKPNIMNKSDTVRKIKRTELWENIREVLARLPLKDTNADVLDRPSAATEIEQLFNSQNKNEFDKGYATAVLNLIMLHGDSTEAHDTFRQQFESIKDVQKLGFFGNDLKTFKDNSY